MKQIISIVCIVLMLAILLVGCGRNSNVSEDTEGRITETTDHSTAAPTTQRATTEQSTTEQTTESTSASVGGSEDGGMSEGVTEDGGAAGRIRRDITGNARF